MIYLLTGENDFEMARFVESIKSSYDGQIDTISAGMGTIDLTSLLLGGSLFAAKHMVILKSLSETEDWPKLADILKRVDHDDIVLILEPKVDKRTKVYKDIAELSVIKSFDMFDPKRTDEAVKWLIDYTKDKGLELNNKFAHMIIERAGLDQWTLANTIERLELAGGINEDNINNQIDLSPSENIFQLFEVALSGDTVKLKNMIEIVKMTEDAYKTLGLISSQAFLLLAVKNTEGGQNIAKDFEAHPYVVSRLKSLSNKVTKTKLKQVVTSLKKADEILKTAPVHPWTALEQALYRIAVS